jgi:acyl-CoA reductase-like NAD-dependent aldehyde dehydrogenase
VREALITPTGKAATDAVDLAREQMATALLGEWERQDIDELARLLRRLADGMTDRPGQGVMLTAGTGGREAPAEE